MSLTPNCQICLVFTCNNNDLYNQYTYVLMVNALIVAEYVHHVIMSGFIITG